MRPPTSCPSLAAKAGGAQGHWAVRGRETGEVEEGLVRLGGREVKIGHGFAGPWPAGPS
jgi:hypothetical protein